MFIQFVFALPLFYYIAYFISNGYAPFIFRTNIVFIRLSVWKGTTGIAMSSFQKVSEEEKYSSAGLGDLVVRGAVDASPNDPTTIHIVRLILHYHLFIVLKLWIILVWF